MKKSIKLSGKVVRGKGDGRKLGFPTANIVLEQDIFQLRHGVYACTVVVNGNKIKGVAHYGPRAVFDETTPQFEVHLLDFDKDIYGETLELELIKFLRETIKFDSVEEMVEQIKEDIFNTKTILLDSQ